MAPTFSVVSSAEDALHALEALCSWAEEVDLVYAWASSRGGTAAHWRCLPLVKVRRAVIGIQFAQTEPYTLEALAARGVLHVIEDTEGAFHPKLVVGRRGGEVRALLGSSNLTVGGFFGNTELNVHFQGPATDPNAEALLSFVEAAWRDPRAFVPDAQWLAEYATLYERRPRPPHRGGAGRLVDATEVTATDLRCGWSEYFALIARQERRSLVNGFQIHVFDHPAGSYLSEAEACRSAFMRWRAFAQMPEAERKRVAGWGDETTGYFGRMTGAGYFKRLTVQAPDQIGRFLDRIPMEGRITSLDVDDCLQEMLAVEGVGLGAATRLLSVKRPDLFLPVNQANRPRLRQVFGRDHASAAAYVELLEGLWSLPWFAATEPADPTQARVWRCRVALLDALLYELPE